MAKTVVGLFDDMRMAQDASERLVKAGFDRSDISIVRSQADQQGATSGTSTNGRSDASGDVTTGEGAAIGAGTGAAIGAAAGGALWALASLTIPGLGPALGVGPLAANLIGGAGIGAVTGGLTGALINNGVPEEDAQLYTEGVRRGGTLLTVRADDARADQAADILSDAGAIDIDERAASYREGAGTAQTAAPAAPTAMAGGTAATNLNRTDMPKASPEAGRRDFRPGEAIPVVEEELAVGKRQVQKGGVRVYSHVVEKPVEEQVTLRDEEVHVERRPVNRPVTDADAAFKEGTIEVTETAEEAVASKRAVVKEEIVVSKDAHERT
ncbi:MAG TPA: YsnF/AvaK domain-containing protein, partial [Tepidisphaeraceae bacterium]|nr:YsnF/AvaK domain-containing protein [Tepidisphaeraceae bacterium]